MHTSDFLSDHVAPLAGGLSSRPNPQDLRGRVDHAVDILVRRLPVGNAHAHRATPAPGGPAEDCLARGDNRRDHFVSTSVVILIAAPGSNRGIAPGLD